MQQLPIWVSLLFVVATGLTLLFVYKASKSKVLIIVLVLLLLVQGVISYSGFYRYTASTPPRFLLLVAPPLVAIGLLFALPAGRRFIDGFDIKWMTWLHIVRVPVEVVLFGLFLYKQVPQLVTFEGRNWDILSGLTAPIIVYFGCERKKINNALLLVWNVCCLVLLVNIVVLAILSAPFPFQRLAFDMPNVGILYFPFIWLPCFVVPAVLFSHMVCIRRLLFSYFTSNIKVPAR